jgi:hypothetical protein
MIKPRPGCFIDPVHPLSRGLVGCWLFNEGAGSRLTDYSGYGNHGVLTNMQPSNDWIGSLHGGSLDFDGTDDAVVVGDRASLDFGRVNFSIAAWINPRSVGENAAGRIVDNENGAGNGYGFYLSFGNELRFFSSGGAVEVAATSGNAITLNSWQHVVVVFNGANAFFYNNSRLIASPSITQVPGVSSVSFVIGNRVTGDRTFDGWIDDVRVYDRLLTSFEIYLLWKDSYANILQPTWCKYFVPVVSPGSSLSSRLSLLGVGK